MATYTTNLNLEKPDENDNFRRQVINENMDKIDTAVAAKADSSQVQGMLADYVRQPGYAEATGSANAYLASLSPTPAEYASGMGIAVKINVTNTGASTINIDGLGAKSILDSKGNAMTAGKLKSGSIYSLKYNGVNFILQGEGGGGTAGAGDVLSGKTFTNDAGDQTGAMVNRGAVVITPGTVNQTILAGYHNGSGYVKGDANLVAGNIKKGINLFGVAGTYSKNYAEGIIEGFTMPANKAEYKEIIVGFEPSLIILFIQHNYNLPQPEWSFTASMQGYSIPPSDFDSTDGRICYQWSKEDIENCYVYINTLSTIGFVAYYRNKTGADVNAQNTYWIAIG